MDKRYELFESKCFSDQWYVELVDACKSCLLVAIFPGPESRERATEYADWKNARPVNRE